ncbi:thiolase family protein [Alicyclobacillus contaminans]|uniref:thiolase family protein n=1 Tax=Alicyclobacillus contaminans TaxID=392016 RepID=UPI0003FD07FD|nr:thiolase family protein [Alicyclobacillus contaminans]
MNRPQRDALVVAALRTPIGKVGGRLRAVPPESLAATVIQAVLQSAGATADQIHHVVLGNVVGPGGNIARLALLEAGFPLHVPGYTVDMQCGSGLQSMVLAAQSILAGQAEMVVAGGVESASRAPWKIAKPDDMYRGLPHIYARARFNPESIGDPDMGVAAEHVARRYEISRAAQDAFALDSHRKALAAEASGFFESLRTPVQTPAGDTIAEDECPRPDTSLERLSALPPAFVDEGTVTAGNACPINDGASVCLLTSTAKARELGCRMALRYVDSVVVGVDPNYLGIGPIPAVQALMERTGYRLEDIDLVEFNEAFAAQVLACVNAWAWPHERLNVNGGAIALGHPYGASGAVLVTHLFHEMMRRQDARLGMTTMGVGGGLGIAVLWEKVKVKS